MELSTMNMATGGLLGDGSTETTDVEVPAGPPSGSMHASLGGRSGL
jgi:hypothetical protein